MSDKMPYNDEQPNPTASEPGFAYGRTSVPHGNAQQQFSTMSTHSRMSVDEYFDKLWYMYQKKRENLQS